MNYAEGETISVDMHDGSKVVLRKLDREYDPTDRAGALAYVQERAARNEHVTGLIYLGDGRRNFHARHNTPDGPLNAVPFERLCPGRGRLDGILARYR